MTVLSIAQLVDGQTAHAYIIDDDDFSIPFY